MNRARGKDDEPGEIDALFAIGREVYEKMRRFFEHAYGRDDGGGGEPLSDS